jgi:hypothetical protein
MSEKECRPFTLATLEEALETERLATEEEIIRQLRLGVTRDSVLEKLKTRQGGWRLCTFIVTFTPNCEMNGVKLLERMKRELADYLYSIVARDEFDWTVDSSGLHCGIYFLDLTRRSKPLPPPVELVREAMPVVQKEKANNNGCLIL